MNNYIRVDEHLERNGIFIDLDTAAEIMNNQASTISALEREVDELKEVIKLAGGHIVELCTVGDIPPPTSTLQRIDKALAAGEAQ